MTRDRESLLNNDWIAEGAFLLLSCSGIERYERMARRLAVESGLRDRILSEERSQERAIERARSLWRRLISKSRRDVEEIELAALLCALSQVSNDGYSSLLVRISMTEGAATSWLAALSRRLHQARPFDREEAIASADRNGWACFKGLSKGADLRDLVIIDRSTTFLSGVDAADLDLAA